MNFSRVSNPYKHFVFHVKCPKTKYINSNDI